MRAFYLLNISLLLLVIFFCSKSDSEPIIYYKPTTVTTVDTTLSNYTTINTQNSTAYTTTTTNTILHLNAPTEFEGMIVSSGYSLKWTDNSNNESGFKIERKLKSDLTYSDLKILPQNANCYIDNTYSNSNIYEYRICSYNDDTISDYVSLSSDLKLWTYIKIVCYDALWGSPPGPNMDDNIIGAHLNNDMVPKLANSQNINGVLLGDSYGDTEGIIYASVDSINGTSIVTHKPEANMGDVQTYKDFFDWVVQNFPAQKYVVSYWSHGGGSYMKQQIDRAIGYDYYPDDELDTEEMGQIFDYLKSITGKDTDVFSVCACLTQMIENVYALKDSVKYFVAGESVVGCGTDLLDTLYNHPELTSEELASTTVLEHVNITWQNDVVFSSVDVSKTDEFVQKIDTLAVSLMNYISAGISNVTAIKNVASNTQNMSYLSTPYYKAAYLDIYDFCDNLLSLSNSNISSISLDIKDFIDNQLLTEFALLNNDEGLYGDCHGISIFHPNDNYSYVSYNDYSQLKFSQATSWDEYLKIIYP